MPIIVFKNGGLRGGPYPGSSSPDAGQLHGLLDYVLRWVKGTTAEANVQGDQARGSLLLGKVLRGWGALFCNCSRRNHGQQWKNDPAGQATPTQVDLKQLTKAAGQWEKLIDSLLFMTNRLHNGILVDG